MDFSSSDVSCLQQKEEWDEVFLSSEFIICVDSKYVPFSILAFVFDMAHIFFRPEFSVQQM